MALYKFCIIIIIIIYYYYYAAIMQKTDELQKAIKRLVLLHSHDALVLLKNSLAGEPSSNDKAALSAQNV